MSRGRTAVSSIVGIKHRANGLHGNVEPACNLAIGRLEASRVGGLGIKIGRQLGTIGAQRLHLSGEPILATIMFTPPLDGSFQRVERRNQPGGSGFDQAGAVDHIAVARNIRARRNVLRTVWIRHLTQDLAQARSRRPLPIVRPVGPAAPRSGPLCGVPPPTSIGQGTYTQKFMRTAGTGMAPPAAD
jgi:hypothetical protein